MYLWFQREQSGEIDPSTLKAIWLDLKDGSSSLDLRVSRLCQERLYNVYRSNTGEKLTLAEWAQRFKWQLEKT